MIKATGTKPELIGVRLSLIHSAAGTPVTTPAAFSPIFATSMRTRSISKQAGFQNFKGFVHDVSGGSFRCSIRYQTAQQNRGILLEVIFPGCPQRRVAFPRKFQNPQ
jgi:hypothetical protein